MRFGDFAQAAASIFSAHERGTLDTSAPRRVADQVGQWIAHLSKNAAIQWGPRLVDPDLCTFCDQDAVTDCLVCGDACCMAHAHVSHRADGICDECVQAAITQRAKGRRARRKRREAAPEPQQSSNSIPFEVLQAFSMLGISPTATWQEVNDAYRAAAVANHPDRTPPAHRATAENRMKGINAAFNTLKMYYQKAG